MLALSLRQLDLAERDLSMAASLSRGHDRMRALVYRAEARHALGDRKGALEDVQEVLDQEPTQHRALNTRGRLRMEQGDPAAAEADYTAAIASLPLATYFGNRANARKQLGRFDEMLADYAEALRLDPQNASTYFNRGNFWLDQRRFAEALRDYNDSIRLDPTFWQPWNNRGIALWELGNRPAAIESWRAARDVCPDPALRAQIDEAIRRASR